MKKRSVFLVTLIAIFIFSTPVFGSDSQIQNANNLGIITLIPPLVALVLAFITKNVIIALFLGTLSGTFILNIINGGLVRSTISAYTDFTLVARQSLGNQWNAGLILQVLTIGGFVFLLGKMGGSKAIAEALSKKAKTKKESKLIAWFLGLAVFFDDYASILLVGPVMQSIFDKMKISREKLAFIIDATAAPAVGIALVSTWIGMQISLIDTAFNDANIMYDGMDAFTIFIRTIPFRFYSIFLIVFVLINAISLRDFGPMYKAELKARLSKDKLNTEAENTVNELEPEDHIKLSIWNGIIPVGVLVIGAFISFYSNGLINIINGSDYSMIAIVQSNPMSFETIRTTFSNADASIAFFQAALFASIVAIFMAVYQKMFTLSKAIEIWSSGLKTMVGTVIILILVWSLSGVISNLGTAIFLGDLLSDTIPMFLLPSIIFLFGAVISFSTGTSFGTMGILMPLAVPLAIAVQPEGVIDLQFVIVCTSAVLSGAVFGDHLSPISDTTILSTMAAGCETIDHVSTQMPYGLFVAAITVVVGYIPAGLGVSPIISNIMALLIIIGLLFIFGKKVGDEIEEGIN